jgi:ArsR family transcriptional regulator, arsenate/arsenite/antimonite-responsive transcriptional repressor
MTTEPEMLDFVKALAHADRLKIVGVLVHAPASLARITEAMSLPTRVVFNHLEFLNFVGVVHEKEGLYELDTAGLELLARRQLEGSRQQVSSTASLDPGRQKVLAAFLDPDGAIRKIPNSITQPAKFQVVLEYLQAAFQPGAVYTEKEVNTIIHRFHADVAGLRRDLVDARLLARVRDGSRYWRVEKEQAE